MSFFRGPGAMLNPGMMLPQNMGPTMLGPGGLMGNVPAPHMPFLGPMVPPANIHGMEEPGSRLLRLDEAGEGDTSQLSIKLTI